MKLNQNIGRAEMEVLRYVADHPGATVREVGEFLAETKGQTRNTALNMMERLRKKGFLEREKSDSVFRYRPALSKPKLYEDVADAVLSPAIASAKALGCARAQLKSTFDRLLGEYFGQKKRVGAHGIRDNRDERPE